MRSSSGFTLLELAVVLVIVSLMVGFGLQAFDKAGEQECYKVTEERLDTINRALQDFLAANKRLPKPAARTYGSSQPQFGYELATNDTALIGVNGSVLFGAIPHATLNLPIAYAADCWGNKFTYLVTNTLTSADPSTGYGSGANGTITLRSGTIAAPNTQSTEVAYAVISHGMDGFGAKPLAAGNNANDFCTVNTGKIDTENCDNANTVIFNSSRNIAKGSATYFDDLLIYSTRIKSAACESGKSVSWNGGMCSGTTSTAIANRDTGTVTNSKAGSQGSSTVVCNDGALSVTPPSNCCLRDGQNSQGSASNCCNGDSDGNGICGTQPSCIADGQSSGGDASSCCNGDSDNNGTCGTQSGCTGGSDYTQSLNGADCAVETDPVPICCTSPENIVYTPRTYTASSGHPCYGWGTFNWTVVTCGSPSCIADGQSSGGNASNCCNGDPDSDGTCGGSMCNQTLACFTAGTQVTLASGETRSIEKITKGDKVRIYDERAGSFTNSEVVDTLHHEAKPDTLIEMQLSNGRTLTANHVHMIRVGDSFISAGTIAERFAHGEAIAFTSEDKPVDLVAVRVYRDTLKLYNLHVRSPYDTATQHAEAGHTYIAEGIVVHNEKAQSTIDAYLASMPNASSQACEQSGGEVYEKTSYPRLVKCDCGGTAPSCIADGQSSGGNASSCCNGDSDGNGTCGTQSSTRQCSACCGEKAPHGTERCGSGAMTVCNDGNWEVISPMRACPTGPVCGPCM